MHLVVFEGSRWPSFAPLSISRPVFTLLSGLSTLLDKQVRNIQPTRVTLWVRPGLAEYCQRHVVPGIKVPTEINTPLDDEPALLCSGRALHFGKYTLPTEPGVVVDEGDLIRQAFVKSPGLSPQDCLTRSAAWLRIMELPKETAQARLPDYLWDLVHWNEESIVSDVAHLKDHPHPLPPGPYHAICDEDIFVSPEAKLMPGVVLDASKGPVVVDVGATIGANAVLQGPVYIGKHAMISPLSFIYGGTSIGPICKVGGEVSNSIFLGYTNKAHDGFVGHSYIGEWVNLGAGTTTSNLKNTYGPIGMRIGTRHIATDRRFLGSMIGDHTKTAIGTRLMSGSYIGYCSLLAASGLPPRFIPSFTFWTDKGTESYRLEKAREVISQVYARRGRVWDQDDEKMLKYALDAGGRVET
ncbi:MAG: putative sugar nucleotidyl transferase [Tepidisphaeraceae bacterium]|jgi:UDP-N-acetylglucosamine diphosphorylase/glucosamine-1-phosphate N-acetyltransferase